MFDLQILSPPSTKLLNAFVILSKIYLSVNLFTSPVPALADGVSGTLYHVRDPNLEKKTQN